MGKPIINIRRAYSPELPKEGYRVYVDRLWPRGLSHAVFHYDLWDKEISPGAELREWFHADPEHRWREFEKRYKEELEQNPAFDQLKRLLSDKEMVTLLYSSHDEVHNNAVVLRDMLNHEF